MTSFELRDLTLRNRVVSTSHEPAYTEDGMPKDRYRLYHLEKARGGVGLTMIGGSAVVSPDSPPAFGNMLLYRDEVVPWLRRLADDVHEAGAAVMCQITHLGRRTSNFTGDWLPLVYPSRLREPQHRSFPKIAESWDVDRIVRHYAEAAARCQAAGLDGIEIESYSHLFDAWVSPATNLRSDAFGSDPEARLAFPLRVLAAIRAAVGPDFIVGVRMSMDEDLPSGLGLDDTEQVMRRYVAAGVDFCSVIKGGLDTDARLAATIPSMGTPSAPFLDFVGEVRRRVDVPVMHAARVNDVATARYAVREGLLDLVGMTRPQLADPHLVAKVARGDEDRIRPCVGASYCLDAIYDSGDAKCIHNPATGREQSLPHLTPPAAKARTAVVVGAGPAGLEAARVLGERGHHVTVLEAADRPGGQLLLASSTSHRRDLIGIVDWRVAEAKHARVEFRFGTYADADLVRSLGPDVVVVATGGVPDRSCVPVGAELVNDTWDALDGTLSVGNGSVLVYDDSGAEPALDAAEQLATLGGQVELVTPERTIGIGVGSMNSPAYLRVFASHGVTMTVARRLAAVRRAEPGSGHRLVATLTSEYAADAEIERHVDHVVVEHGTTPNDELYLDLVPGSVNLGEVDQAALLSGEQQTVTRNPAGGYQLFRIGDAVASRNVHAAVYDALRLCLTI
ncbi:2,4-dienoyl-CoA reductase-like NADH-dependent reductase (Old Yellow Enzyme family) [Nocardioides albertanoniae]|uniref:2,4-dienoyl-CoA reductase-like NADH-dependent reductase (Old Yellow Enzyme family) n=1 Tax=Nocardioides albertanoniae TaxID=1175486 RepID=A0A543AAX4_9ACTN|nr:FAD-dependent oxidoreductase [Nocardioides albertanoniae]TQL69764.1 2,4-dienoyl-CoA reductase-like NADH-dependent reductase (Old Yellow Enzyme family) [Nocardioides albertanoniae]